MKVLVVDVGGSHVKLRASGQQEAMRFDTGPEFTPRQLVEGIRNMTSGWTYDVVSLGYPGTVGLCGPKSEPGNLGTGWVGFDYADAFGRPVRVANDAALQALGAYDGGRMLFLGLGTGLGSALVVDRVVVPMELGRLRMEAGKPLGDQLGCRGLEQLGEVGWGRAVIAAVEMLQDAFEIDYVVLGGGNAGRVESLPGGCRKGGNEDAFIGGFRLWEEAVEPHDHPSSSAWRMLG